MQFEWDQAKNETCFERRGFDFTYVLGAFLDPRRLIRQDVRWEYGEVRYQLLGMCEHRVFCVVYTLRGESIRIISARKANKREVRLYENRAHEN